MTRAMTLIVTVAAAILLGGCYVSLHPLVSDEVRVYEPGLVGTWVATGDKDDTWTFRPAGAKSPTGYDIDIVEDRRTARFSGTLARIDGLLILEIKPGDNGAQCALLDEHEWFQMHVIGVHSFMRIGLGGDRLRLHLVDAEWLDAAIAAKRIAIAHEHLDDDDPHAPGQPDVHSDRDRLLLTAPTSDLQALVRAHGKAGLFDEDDPGEFTRRR
ncbi:MAG: hypothetical protein AB1806_12355 [Acidobacteriota bacterium]